MSWLGRAGSGGLDTVAAGPQAVLVGGLQLQAVLVAGHQPLLVADGWDLWSSQLPTAGQGRWMKPFAGLSYAEKCPLFRTIG